GSLFCLPACMCMELDLKKKVTVWVSPLTVDSLVLLAVPPGPSGDQIEPMLLKIGLGFIDSLTIIFIIVFECVSDSIMDSRREVVDALLRLKGDSLGELFFVAIGVLEGELLSVGDQAAMVELGFDTAHGGGEAVVAVVAIGVASFRFAATGQAPIGGAILLWSPLVALPSPRPVPVAPCLVRGGSR